MSTRSEPQTPQSPDMSIFETRSTTKGFSTSFLTFIAFASLVEILVHFLQEDASWWILFGLFSLAVLFHARLFVLMHDCGHNRLTSSNRINNWIGHICGLTYLMPFTYWRDLHNLHHRYQGNLDKRNQHFDLWTMTLSEYQNASPVKKLFYRFYRMPFSLFVIGPILFFLVFLRWPPGGKTSAAIRNIFYLDLLLAGLIWISIISPGFRFHLIVFFGVSLINFSAAIWLFYQQHVFADTYWKRDSDFKNDEISFQGSSFIDFPNWMKWFMASIGYHHIHHFNTKIPYYHLKSARHFLLEQNILVHEKNLGLIEMIKNTQLKLWDEKEKKLVRFPT